MAGDPLSPREQDLQNTAEFIRQSFHRRPTLAEIARVAHLSRFHLHRIFKQRFGESPFQMVVRLQIDLAKKLLMRGVRPAEVTKSCGFSNQSHFTRSFKTATGVTPGEWQRANRK